MGSSDLGRFGGSMRPKQANHFDRCCPAEAELHLGLVWNPPDLRLIWRKIPLGFDLNSNKALSKMLKIHILKHSLSDRGSAFQ